MIDCFRYDNKVPSLEFLKCRGCRRLLFFGLTHPHDDHYSGILDVFQHFLVHEGIGEMWRFPVLDAKFVDVLLGETYKFLPSKKRELDGLLSALFLAKENKIPLQLCSVGKSLLRDEVQYGLQIESIAPNSTYVQEAESGLIDSLKRGEVTAREKNWPLNRLSTAFLLRVGPLRAILAGDVPRWGWTLARLEPGFPQDCGGHFLKASHHGSHLDNTADELERLIGKARGDIAVVTRYSGQDLPRREGLDVLEGKFRRVIVLGRLLSGPSILTKSKRLAPIRKYNVESVRIRLTALGIQADDPVELGRLD